MEQAWVRRGADGLRLAVTLLTAVPLPGPRPKDGNGSRQRPRHHLLVQ
jgi:hypothetical protein